MGISAYAVDLRIRYVDQNGVPTGKGIGVLNPMKLLVTSPEPEILQQISRKRDSYGQALDEIAISKPVAIELETDDAADAETLAWNLNGNVTGYSQAAATVASGSPESQTAIADTWIQLANRAVSAVVVTDATGATTYAAGTDYLLDAISGKFMALSSGTIVDASVLHFTYSAAAVNGKTINVGAVPAIYVQIDGEGKNLATGAPVHIVARRCRLSSIGGLDFVGGKLTVAGLKGTAFVVGANPAVQVDVLEAA